jgi:hypothetical protein
MYSGTTLTAASGRILGAHQKIDRKARKQLRNLLPPGALFPATGRILHFEGRNGPDAIKRKSPAKDEPWHYFNPFDDGDTLLVELVEAHYDNLVRALREEDEVVAAFEAAWLAHAVVDGLTPAHHYPYEEKLDELRGGLGKETRVTFKDKVLLPGDTRRQAISNNWKMWGPKGLFTTHYAFEWGVSTILLTMSLSRLTQPSGAESVAIHQRTVGEYFRLTAKEVAALGMYDEFMKHGWTVRLARKARRQLVPTIIKSVTLIWYKAAYEARGQMIGSEGNLR